MRYLIVFLVLFTASSALADRRSSLYVLTSVDAESLYGGFQYALNRSPDHQAVDWTNPISGLNGSTVPLRSYQTSYGQVCREYLSTVQLGVSTQQAFGTACRQADGHWKIAGEKPVKRSSQTMKFVLVGQQAGQGCPYAFLHPPVGPEQLKPLHRGPNFHSDRFHEKIRTLKREGQTMPEPRRIERQQPSKLLKLVAY